MHQKEKNIKSENKSYQIKRKTSKHFNNPLGNPPGVTDRLDKAAGNNGSYVRTNKLKFIWLNPKGIIFIVSVKLLKLVDHGGNISSSESYVKDVLCYR